MEDPAVKPGRAKPTPMETMAYPTTTPKYPGATMLIRLPSRARAEPQRISSRGCIFSSGIRPHWTIRVAAAPANMATPMKGWA